MRFSRRSALACASAALLLPGCARAQTALARTPAQTEGPYYPVDRAIERDADLTRLAGRSARALGQVIEVAGRVVDTNGAAVGAARLELWQANAAGRYAHPRDSSSAPLDTNFQGYALLETDAAGRFSIVSIKPGAYGAGRGRRTPHLHWKVESGARRLTTQMYFPGEALNESDGILRSVGDARALIAQGSAANEPGALALSWTIVLPV
jgi:protocatechuate 3,4-dioxygenase, beta subunit